MKQRMLKTTLAAILTLAPAAAMADGMYLGAKAGLMATDANGFDDATNAGLVIGKDVLGVVLGEFAVEADYTTTIDEGTGNGINEWEIDTLGGYGVFRTAGPVYLKARAGVVRSDITVNGVSDSNTGAAGGLGLGLSLGLVQFELDYTQMEQDNDDVHFVSLTANF